MTGMRCRHSMRRAKEARAPHPAVAVVEADDELLEDPARLLLRQAPMRPVPERVVEQVAALRVLHRDRQVARRQEDLRRVCGLQAQPHKLHRTRTPCILHIISCRAAALQPFSRKGAAMAWWTMPG